MKLKDLYKKKIERPVNPAVSVTQDPNSINENGEKLSDIEIGEYVFTDEIINGLYKILYALKNNKPYSHTGIWIDGYYGTGKSHFLKYLDYCITPETRDLALGRLKEAVWAIDPMDSSHKLDPEIDRNSVADIIEWVKEAEIDTCMFNLETSYDNSTDRKTAFIHVFWNELNRMRGFNNFNLSLAQHLEKPLAQRGKLEEFKREILEETGVDWNNANDAADIVDNETDIVLEIAKQLVPSLTIESVRERIIKRDTTVSIEKFAQELASFIKEKGENYRLIMFADEVSQFINKERDRYLNLQEIVTKVPEMTDKKIWFACTAQQELEEVMDDCDIHEGRDSEGKIRGRFEVKVSLKGSSTEYITQKRILDKKDEVKEDLRNFYKQRRGDIEALYKLPTGFSRYESDKEFVNCYPFVPYQFPLIKKVFDAFRDLQYVAKEVKGNERSILKVVHSTAITEKDQEMGRFISFDSLYNSMFEEGLQARGQKAIENAERVIKEYRDPDFGRRVVNVLFMICNLKPTDKLQFPASLQNITVLMLNSLDTPKLTVQDKVESVLNYLSEKSIIQEVQSKDGQPSTYIFYSEEEMKVASLIQAVEVDNAVLADQLKEIFFKYLGNPKNKEPYLTRTFTVNATIKQRVYNGNNGDVTVDFDIDNKMDAHTFALQSTSVTKMVYYLGPLFLENTKLRNDFWWYCHVNQYLKTPVESQENANVREKFAKRAQELYTSRIVEQFAKILDSCPVISGNLVIEDAELSGTRGAERYHKALNKHFSNIYTRAKMVDVSYFPKTSEALRVAILRPIQPGDYEGTNAELTAPEHEMEIFLNNNFNEVSMSDIIAKFSKAPYGWNDVCTLYVVNELVRRHKRDYSYSNNPNVEVQTVANRLMSELGKFTVHAATAIPDDVIKAFTKAWKDIFGTMDVFPSQDSTTIFRQCQDKDSEKGLPKKRDAYAKQYKEMRAYPFSAPVNDAIDLFEKWIEERDTLKFFNLVISSRDEARTLLDRCKEVFEFYHYQMPKYLEICKFVDDNHDNFQFVPDQKDKVKELQAIKTDEWPKPKMKDYIRLRKELSFALDEVKKELRQRIKEEYEKTFAQLEESCVQQDVDKAILPNKEAIIHTKTASENILVLQTNLSTDAFYAEQAAKILAARKPDGGGPNPPGGESKTINKVLSTRTTAPLKTEADVDKYLESLKKQIMKCIDEGKAVMITK